MYIKQIACQKSKICDFRCIVLQKNYSFSKNDVISSIKMEKLVLKVQFCSSKHFALSSWRTL